MNERFKGRMRGKRIGIVPEFDSNKKLNEAMLKAVTGESTLSGRELRENSFSFINQIKLLFLTNHIPHVDADSFAFYRRMVVIPFNRRFAEEEQDKNLIDKLRKELPGIFNWALEGLRMYQQVKDNWELPNKIREAIKKQRETCDQVKLFLEECSKKSDKSKVKAPEVYKRYNEWVDEGREFQRMRLSKQEFYKSLGSKGFEKRIGTGGNNYIYGLELL